MHGVPGTMTLHPDMSELVTTIGRNEIQHLTVFSCCKKYMIILSILMGRYVFKSIKYSKDNY